MGKFDDDKREDIQNIFAYLNVPDEDDFAAFIQAIADGIEWHEHVRWGGPGSGKGYAAPILPDLGEHGTVPDTMVDNRDTWLKLLASHPYLATEGLPKVWHIPCDEGDCHALTCDAPHLYAGLSTSPAQVARIDISDMTVLQTWTGEEGEDCCQALVCDGTFLYAGLADLELPYTRSQSNFILIKSAHDPQVVYERMLEQGVIIRPMAAFGAPDCFRITVGTRAENERLLQVVGDVMETLGMEE